MYAEKIKYKENGTRAHLCGGIDEAGDRQIYRFYVATDTLIILFDYLCWMKSILYMYF